MTNIEIQIPDSISQSSYRLAALDGVSFNQFVSTALAEKTAVLMSQTYLQERASRGDRASYDAVLSRVSKQATVEPI
ncbi:MAG: hypothetical protein QM533_07455 [Cytophagales bacterium]|nr:hypothetical protein [Cytophagales bacterium]